MAITILRYILNMCLLYSNDTLDAHSKHTFFTSSRVSVVWFVSQLDDWSLLLNKLEGLVNLIGGYFVHDNYQLND